LVKAGRKVKAGLPRGKEKHMKKITSYIRLVREIALTILACGKLVEFVINFVIPALNYKPENAA
jgi:hypothetical protein